MTKPTSIGKLTVQEEDKRALQRSLAHITSLVNAGDVTGMVAIVIRLDRSFAIYQTGDLRRVETIGLLEQAQFDLLNEEPPYPERKFKHGETIKSKPEGDT